MIIEMEFDSLAQAQSQGPAALVERCVREGLRLLSSPSYCERDGRGVLSVEAAGPLAPVLIVSGFEQTEESKAAADASLARALGEAQQRGYFAPSSNPPAAVVAAQPEIDQ